MDLAKVMFIENFFIVEKNVEITQLLMVRHWENKF